MLYGLFSNGADVDIACARSNCTICNENVPYTHTTSLNREYCTLRVKSLWTLLLDCTRRATLLVCVRLRTLAQTSADVRTES